MSYSTFNIYSIFHKVNKGSFIELEFYPPAIRLDLEIVDQVQKGGSMDYDKEDYDKVFPESFFLAQERHPNLKSIKIHSKRKKTTVKIPSGWWADINTIIEEQMSNTRVFSASEVRAAHLDCELPF